MRFARPLEEILKEGPQWQDRPDREHTAPDRWGKSHWALLVLVDDRSVRYHGLIDWERVQVSARHWPMLWAARRLVRYGLGQSSEDGAEYGLYLKPDQDGRAVLLSDHCEVDALMDLADAGLVTVAMPRLSSSGKSYLRPDGHALNDPSPADLVTGHIEWLLMPWAKFGLTEQGWEVSAALRRHKASGGKYAEFVMPEEVEEQ